MNEDVNVAGSPAASSGSPAASSREPRGGAVAVARAEAGQRSLIGRMVRTSQATLLLFILLFAALVALQNENFLTFANMINIGRDASSTFIIAVAATFVLVGGGLDLSVGSVFALSSVSSALFMSNGGWPIPVAFVGGVAVGSFCGVINAVIIVYGRIPPLITTLGMLYIARGLTWVSTGGRGTQFLPDAFGSIASFRLFGVPMIIIYAAVIGIAAHVILEHMRFGHQVRATGGNREAARASGINVTRTTFILFVASGTAAGLAGVLMASRLNSGQPSIGQSLELQVITAAIVGGTSLFGGLGTIPGTLLGTLMISTLNSGLVQMQIDPLWQNVVIGVVLISAVGIDQIRRARMWRESAGGGARKG
jgi:ribose transport system permease protein